MSENTTPPHSGERVLFCEHADVGEDYITLKAPHHWYFIGENEVMNPDGEWFPVRWLCVCAACQKVMGTEPRDYKAGDECDFAAKCACWIGEPPEIARFV